MPSRSQLKLARHRRIKSWQEVREAEAAQASPVRIRCGADGCCWSTMTDIRVGHAAFVEHRAAAHF